MMKTEEHSRIENAYLILCDMIELLEDSREVGRMGKDSIERAIKMAIDIEITLTSNPIDLKECKCYSLADYCKLTGSKSPDGIKSMDDHVVIVPNDKSMIIHTLKTEFSRLTLEKINRPKLKLVGVS